jgi:arylsulfatase A-like enzyme
VRTRRGFLVDTARAALLAAAASALPLRRLAAATVAGKSRPNVLLIGVDDLNDWIGALGVQPDVSTPHLDRLAARGELFTRCYSNAVLCNPSRTSFVTGMRPSTTGIYDNTQRWHMILPDATTMMSSFRAGGYRVVGRGKICHNDPAADDWDVYVPQHLDRLRVRASGIPDELYWGPLDVDDEALDDTQVASWTAQQLRSGLPEPFFLGCGFFRPHHPWFVPRKYFEMYPPDRIHLPPSHPHDLDDVPATARKWAEHSPYQRLRSAGLLREAVAAYLAAVSYTDANVGRVMAGLDASPYAHNTIVVFWSDHGFNLGEKELWGKGALWEDTTRIPLIVSVPGMTDPGSRCERPVSLIDVYPTLVDLCQLPPNPALEGVSLRPLLENPSAPWSRPVLTTQGFDNHSVRSQRWRYTRYADGSEELYDELADPHEWTNLADRPEHATVKGELAAAFPRSDAPAAPRWAKPWYLKLRSRAARWWNEYF